MNVEHRTSNIEHRIMCPVYFRTTEQSETTIRQSTFDIRHSNVSHEELVPWISDTRNPTPETRNLFSAI